MRRREQRALWRLSAWGCATALAFGIAAFSSQTNNGKQRLFRVFGGESAAVRLHESQQHKAIAANQAETRRLAAEIRKLAADRERLIARIARLEQDLKDVTGSVKQEAVQAATAVANKISATRSPSLIAPLAMPVLGDTAATWTISAPRKLPDRSSNVAAAPLPPPRVVDAAPRKGATVPPPARHAFGVDVGGARSLTALHAHWASVKANFGPLLTGLHPAAMLERRFSNAPYRLLIGPLANRAQAENLCARFAAGGVACRPTRFANQTPP